MDSFVSFHKFLPGYMGVDPDNLPMEVFVRASFHRCLPVSPTLRSSVYRPHNAPVDVPCAGVLGGGC